MQPLLDVREIMRNRHCHCLCCRLSGGGREGRPHASLAIAGLDGNDNRSGDCLSKKRGWTREKERGNLKMGLFFYAVLFCYCFLAFLFQCRSIDFLSRSSQLLDGLLLQDFSFSHSNLVVDLIFIKFKSTVYRLSLARSLFQSSKLGHHISVWQLSSSLGNKTVAGSNRSCISSASFGIQLI